tara:strand:- start:254 stop:361 length:108 start_codon:yes stop_codon:yes gene_type:complete
MKYNIDIFTIVFGILLSLLVMIIIAGIGYIYGLTL